MKTIGYFINTYLRRSEGFIHEQVVNIKNYSVEVLTRTRANEEIFPYDRVNCIEKNSGSGFEGIAYTLFRRSAYLERTVKEKKIGLIHAHFGVDAVYALPLVEKLGLPLITTFHGHDITRLPKFMLYPPAWFNYWAHFENLKRKGALFIAVSDYIRDALIEKGFPKDRVKTHYLGIDTGIVPVGPGREKIVLTAGRLVEKKGTKYLIQACAALSGEFPDLKLVICGDGPLKGELEALAEQAGIKDSTLFTGWQSKQQVLELMKTARVFALPSVTAENGDAEGLGMVLLEAMALGKPCVGTHHGGIPDAVIDNETGYLAKEKDPADLAVKLRSLLTDYPLCERLGKNARAAVERKFDIKKQVTELEGIYGGMLK